MVDEHPVVERERDLGQRRLKEERVPTAAQLGIGEERLGQGGYRRYRRRDGPAPARWLVGDGAIGRQRAPVVADEDGVGAAAQRLVQRVDVTDQGTGLVAAI